MWIKALILALWGTVLFPLYALSQQETASSIYKSKSTSYKPYSLRLEFEQRGDVFENELENSFVYSISAIPRLEYRVSSNFSLEAELGLRARVGSVQSRFGDLRSRSTVVFRDARFRFFGDGFLDWDFSVGAINQRRINKGFDNFITKLPLPGFEERLNWAGYVNKGSKFELELLGFQGLLTSESLTLDFSEKESVPKFFLGNLEGRFLRETSRGATFWASINGGLFTMVDLPAVVADQSRIFGNTIRGIDAGSEFVYDFQGWVAGWELGMKWKKLHSSLRVHMLHNSEAPDGRNNAQLAAVNTSYKFSPNINIEVQPYAFFTESDATVSFYNSLGFGHNNREGYGIFFTLGFPKRKLKVKFNYVYAGLLEEDDIQLDQHYGKIELEYKSDIF